MTKAQIIVQRKTWLRTWALEQHVDLTGYKANLPIMGAAARRVLAAFQKWCGLAPTGRWNGESVERLRLYIKPPIVPHVWRPLSSYTRRSGKPPGIVFHHAAAASASVEDVNRWHLARGMNGIGYHFYVTREGVIHRGRPEWAIGAHTLGYNTWLGVCAEGNYQLQRMPDAQLKALEAVRAYLHRKYGGVDKRHSDLNSTACPGRNYPWTELIR